MNPLWCPHPARTAPDEDGYAICAKCGTALAGLTEATISETLRLMKERGIVIGHDRWGKGR